MKDIDDFRPIAIIILVIAIILSFVFVIAVADEKPPESTNSQLSTEKIDYQIIINKDSIKLLDLKNNIIYKDTFNFNNPSKLEEAIIKDNL